MRPFIRPFSLLTGKCLQLRRPKASRFLMLRHLHYCIVSEHRNWGDQRLLLPFFRLPSGRTAVVWLLDVMKGLN